MSCVILARHVTQPLREQTHALHCTVAHDRRVIKYDENIW